MGRIDYIDSPISGKLAVFNGVDAWIQVDPPAGLGLAPDFSLSLWVFPMDRKPSTLLARKGWSLAVLDNGVLKFSSAGGALEGAAGGFAPGQWHHILVSVKKDGPSTLSIDGEKAAEIRMQPAEPDVAQAPLYIGRSVEEAKPFLGLIDEVRLMPGAAASAAAMMDEGIPWLRRKEHTKTPFAGRFELVQDDVVVFAGGENARAGLDLGYLETLMALASAGKRVHFRNMAWEGDTVHEQPRPPNFGSWTDQFRRSGASIVIAQFGQIESLEGKAGVEKFTAAYDALIQQFQQSTKRIVLVSPSPFGKGASRAPDLAARNDDLRLYVDAIRKLAAKHGCLFVDLTTKPMAEADRTRDGLHLSREGHWIAATEIARQLEIPGMSDIDTPTAKGFPRESYEKLRGAIRVKNQWWNDGWRPANWAFLAGDRTEQPSSRDHVDRRIRWFPVEIQEFPALVKREEAKIDALLQAEKK